MPGPQDPDQDQGQDQQQPQGDAGSGGAVSQLLQNVGGALDHLAMVIGQSQATNDDEKQLIQQINQMYGQLLQMLGGQGAGDNAGPPDEAQGQPAPQEAAGNPGARPTGY